MGLDISISRAKKVLCPCCGELVMYKIIETVESSGRNWREILDKLGYNDNWYGLDMELDFEDVNRFYDAITNSGELYNKNSIQLLVKNALDDNELVIINADW